MLLFVRKKTTGNGDNQLKKKDQEHDDDNRANREINSAADFFELFPDADHFFPDGFSFQLRHFRPVHFFDVFKPAQ